MEDEVILTGYCRCLDRSRMVTAEMDDDGLHVDCGYGNCPYQNSCTIAEGLRQLEK